MEPELAYCGRVAGFRQLAEQGQDQVANRREILGRVARPHPTGVFLERDVAGAEETILNPPMRADQLEESFGGALFTRQTRDPKHLFNRLLPLDLSAPPQPKHLADIGPIEIAVEPGRRLNRSSLDASMSFIE